MGTSNVKKRLVSKQHSLICSTHFTESCFVVRPGKRGSLFKENAVPTEFHAFLSHLQKCTKMDISQEKAAKRIFEENVSIQSRYTACSYMWVAPQFGWHIWWLYALHINKKNLWMVHIFLLISPKKLAFFFANALGIFFVTMWHWIMIWVLIWKKKGS